MQVQRTDLEPTKVKFLIKADKKEITSAKELALKHLSPQVKVAGFREGHVPLAVVERNVDQNALQSEVIEHTINNLYASTARQENIRPVANPEISIKKFVPYAELEFEAVVPVVGKIKLADYKKIKLAKNPVKVTVKEVDEVIDTIRTRTAQRKEVKRASKANDELVIDFKGTDAKTKEPINGAEAKDQPITLGSNAFIPGFETELLGLKAGESKTFTITFPKDYQVELLKGKKAIFEVTVNKVQELVLPELDDNFAAATGPFKNVKEFKEDVKKQITLEKNNEENARFETELLEKIAEKTDIEIPEILIDEHVERIEEEEKRNLMYRGQTWEEHLKEEGVSEQEHKQQKRPTALLRVKIGIILAEVSEREKIEVKKEEVEARLQAMKEQYRDPQAQAELDKPEALRDIDSRIRTEKVLAILTKYSGN